MKTRTKLVFVFSLLAAFAAGLLGSQLSALNPQLPPLTSEQREALVARLHADADFYLLWAEWYAYGEVDAAYYRGMSAAKSLDADALETWATVAR